MQSEQYWQYNSGNEYVKICAVEDYKHDQQ